MNKDLYFNILEKEMVIALGCTEPIAIALTAATAAKHIKRDEISKIFVKASPNVIKNAMSVIIPGTKDCGITFSAALGALEGDCDKLLQVLEGLTLKGVQEAKELIDNEKVFVEVANVPVKLYIEVRVETKDTYSVAIIEKQHTNITFIDVNGEIILNRRSQDIEVEASAEEELTLEGIWDFVHEVDIEELTIIKQAIELNKNIALEGLKNSYGLQVGKTIWTNIDEGLMRDDLITYAMALTSAGSDARMAGCTMPVMSNSGSGNQGITATLPVVAASEKLEVEFERMVRAVTLSNLVTIYIKNKFGRLSALCGATVSATGASCGIVYLLKGELKEIRSAIQNMLGNVTGMVCDGAKAGCALKVSTCTNAAVQSAIIAAKGITVQATDGIVEQYAEKTIDNIGRIARDGSNETDKIILDIMVNKKN